MALCLVESLEPRRLLSDAATSAAVAADLSVIRADRYRLRLDTIQVRVIATRDARGFQKVKAADTRVIVKDIQNLRRHEQQAQDPSVISTDIQLLASDEAVLANDIGGMTNDARARRADALARVAEDRADLAADRQLFFIDRGS